MCVKVSRRAIFILLLFVTSMPVAAKTVRYDLVIKKEKMNLSGRREVDFALTVNGGIPAPTLEFIEGDDAEITVRNELKGEEVSVHWHGILLPPSEDGVAYVNTPPIFPGQAHTFRFKVRQHGTYWYHSHTMVQEQKGVYGALIIHPKKETIAYDKDLVVVLSDWSDENADQILRNLRKDGDYYLYKKNSVRSWLGAWRAGKFQNQMRNEWERMGGMDLSDVGYDTFLLNGHRDPQLLRSRPGERVRLRLINAAASTYFYVSLGQEPMRVISADGVDIEPVQAREILMGMAETYDVLFTPTEHKNYELRATAQDVTGYASGWIGDGDEKVSVPDKPAPDLYASMNHASMHAHHDHPLTVDELKAQSPTVWPSSAKVHELKLVLDGDMRRYVWHINGKALFEDHLLNINEGEVVRIQFVNETMMHHPMHLHGHFFRVLNKNLERSPLKHTVDVPPHGARTIEFYANEPGQWMLHCHNLYHMKTGMARVVKYSSFTPTPEMAAHEKHDPHRHDHWYYSGLAEAASNHAQLRWRATQTWNEFELRAESSNPSAGSFAFDQKWNWEGDAWYRRWFGNYLSAIAGGSSYHDRGFGVAGMGYILPWMVHTNLLLNHEGHARVDIGRHFQWSSSFFSELELSWRPRWEGRHETDFEISLMYGPSWRWAAGLMATTESLGVGLHVKF
jgi:FtsP/CotA-like multicopper oxidase with cupredoxin domain